MWFYLKVDIADVLSKPLEVLESNRAARLQMFEAQQFAHLGYRSAPGTH